MPRVPLLTESDLDPADRKLLGPPANLVAVLANSPATVRLMGRIHSWVRKECRLDPATREVVILSVAAATRNRYEFSHHAKRALEVGVPAATIAALGDREPSPEVMSERELRVHRTVGEICRDQLTSASWNELGLHFDPPQLVDIVILTSLYLAIARTISSLDIEVESDYRSYLDAFPMTEAPDV
jgi:alkylhydroperoxidase family enzyme